MRSLAGMGLVREVERGRGRILPGDDLASHNKVKHISLPLQQYDCGREGRLSSWAAANADGVGWRTTGAIKCLPLVYHLVFLTSSYWIAAPTHLIWCRPLTGPLRRVLQHEVLRVFIIAVVPWALGEDLFIAPLTQMVSKWSRDHVGRVPFASS